MSPQVIVTATAPINHALPLQPMQRESRPGYWRRLAALLYEGVLLFGVIAVAGFLYSALTQQRHALEGRAGLQAVLFFVLGLYFVWFWTHGGQTVAMKTWHLRLLDKQGHAVSPLRAMARFFGSWLWFLPALGIGTLAGWQSGWALTGLLLAWVFVYAAIAHLLPGRQAPHDLLCGTRLVRTTPAAPGR